MDDRIKKGRAAAGLREAGLDTAREFASCVTRAPVICLIFILYWAWINMGFQSATFFPGQLYGGIPVPAWMLPATVSMITYFVMALNYRRLEPVLGSRGSAVVSTAIIFVGALCEAARALGDLGGGAEFGLLVVGGMLIGVGTPLLLMCIARIFSWQTPRTVLFQSMVGAVGATALCLGADQLDFGQMCVALCAVGPILCASMVYELKKNRVVTPWNPGRKPKFPSKIFVTSVTHGVALGALLGLPVAGAPLGNLASLSAAMFFAAVAIAVFALALKVDYNTLLYRLAFVVIAAGALIMAALSPVVHAGAFIQLMGFCFLHLAMWGLNCFLVRSFQIPIVWLVGLATGGCMLGEVSMGLIALAAKAAFGSQVAICLVEGGLVMAFMVVALLLSDSRNLKDGWSLSKPSDSKPAFANFDSLLDHVCDQYDLSTRERDVFLLFARGRNRKFIAEWLSVSEETVKSHISAIYRKTGSHNQQEIISIVEEYAREN